jgi:hypothetical protein
MKQMRLTVPGGKAVGCAVELEQSQREPRLEGLRGHEGDQGAAGEIEQGRQGLAWA